jgi:hypothetical protein
VFDAEKPRMDATGPGILDDVDERVARALTVERVLTRLGWFVLLVGVASIAVTVWQYVDGEIEVYAMLELVFGAALATVLSGAVAYGAGTNIGIGAARLAASRPSAPSERTE